MSLLLPRRKFFWFDWLGWLNFLVLQWFFVRLVCKQYPVVWTCPSIKGKETRFWYWTWWVLPLTGFWSDHVFLFD